MKRSFSFLTRARRTATAAAFAGLILAGQQASAANNTFVGDAGGDWHTAANWSLGTVPTAADTVVLDQGVSPVCTSRVNVASLTITNASLTVGNSDYLHVGVSVAGDLVIGDGGTLTVTAGQASSPTDFVAMYDEIEDFVTVGGTFHIQAGGVFTPVADILTGLPVQVVAADFRLDEGGSVDAAGKGYGYLATPSTVPTGAYAENGGYTFAPGHGISYNKGGAYGATASHNQSKAYGFAYAPWLPGSPNGMHSKFTSYPNGDHINGWTRGGGSARIHATDSIFLGGLIDCRACYRFYGSASGGGIWLTAPDFRIAPTAELCAEGGSSANNYGTAGAGTGGRVSLGVGLTDDQISNLATGMPPAQLSLAYGSSPAFIATSVLGGMSPGVTYYTTDARGRQNAGTATWTLNESAATQVSVAGVGASGADAIDGEAFVPLNAQASFGVEDFKPVSETYAHYVVSAWSVTNAEGTVVAQGTGDTASFTPTAGPLYLTWRVSSIEDEITLDIVGDGSVSINGSAVADGATVRAMRGDTLALTPTPGSGAAFILWQLGIDGTHSNDSGWTPTVEKATTLTAVFAPETGTSRSFSNAGGDSLWENADNWSPAGVPTAADTVSIGEGMTAYATSRIYAGSLEIDEGGTLVVGGTTADILSQTAATDEAGLCVARDLTLHGDLSIGGTGLTAPVPLEVLGNLALDGNARLAVYAAPASDFDFATLYKEATVASVDGALTLADSACVYPDAERVTGAPVHFKAGSVSIGADASFNATTRGWGASTMSGELPRFIRAYQGGSISSVRYCSYAPGTGCGSNGDISGDALQAGHGGRADSGDGAIGCTYGYPYAPFLPGSNGGRIPNATQYLANRGGGTIWIECNGQFTLNGALVADGGAYTGNGNKYWHWTSSGGGIWVIAGGFTASDTASASAVGGGSPGTSDIYGSGGGRISVAVRLTDAERDALAAGETPATLTYEDAISFFTTDVSGGEGRALSASENYAGGDGTVSYVRGTATGAEVIVGGDPVLAISEDAAYGTIAVSVGQTVSLSASTYGYNPTNANERYTCTGYLVTNAAGTVVAQGSGTSASFTVADDTTYFSWIWGEPSYQVCVDIADETMGSASCNGTAHTGSFAEWANGTASLVATPASGHEFLYWVGDVQAGTESQATLALPIDATRHVMPVFRPAASATTRTWLGNDGAWLDPANWDGGVIPGLDDSVTIAAGDCLVTNYVEVGSVTVSGTGRLLAGTYQDTAASLATVYTSMSTVMRFYEDTQIEAARVVVHNALSVTDSGEFALGGQNQPYWTELNAGSVALGGSALMMVTAGPIDDTHSFATGSGFITVGGALALRDQSMLCLVCDGYTGGPVVCNVGRFYVATEATVNANYYGYSFRINKSPQSCAGTGCGQYTRGSAHGGKGGGSDNSTYGVPYDHPYGPVQPGACNSPSQWNSTGTSTPGGGVIRVHADHVRIDGTLTAEQTLMADDTGAGNYNITLYSAGAGGSIWITSSGILRIAEGATIVARGHQSKTGYGNGSGGGRISLGRSLTDAEVAALVADGDSIPTRASGAAIEAKDATAFAEVYPNVTVGVESRGSGGAGTFWFLDGGGDVQPSIIILR